MSHEVRDTRYGICGMYVVHGVRYMVMCLEIWIMRIAMSNVESEYSLGGVNFTHRVRDMMFET